MAHSRRDCDAAIRGDALCAVARQRIDVARRSAVAKARAAQRQHRAVGSDKVRRSAIEWWSLANVAFPLLSLFFLSLTLSLSLSFSIVSCIFGVAVYLIAHIVAMATSVYYSRAHSNKGLREILIQHSNGAASASAAAANTVAKQSGSRRSASKSNETLNEKSALLWSNAQCKIESK